MSLIAGGAVDPTVALFGVPFTRPPDKSAYFRN
jgi:hypothetical protein